MDVLESIQLTTGVRLNWIWIRAVHKQLGDIAQANVLKIVMKLCMYSLCYSRLRNKHRGTLINFWNFFQGLRPY